MAKLHHVFNKHYNVQCLSQQLNIVSICDNIYIIHDTYNFVRFEIVQFCIDKLKSMAAVVHYVDCCVYGVYTVVVDNDGVVVDGIILVYRAVVFSDCMFLFAWR